MSVPDSEIERLLPVIQKNCAASGGCAVYRNGDQLTAVMGDKEVFWITQKEGRSPDAIRAKLHEVPND